MKNIITILILILLTLTSCATVKIPVPTGGSKSDGIINLSYQYGSFEDPQVDWTKAKATAKNSCARWGYKAAEAFGGATSTCVNYSPQYGCNRTQVNIKYQCVD